MAVISPGLAIVVATIAVKASAVGPHRVGGGECYSETNTNEP